MLTTANNHRHVKPLETFVVFGYDHENPYVSCAKMRHMNLDHMLRHPSFKDSKTTLPFSFNKELFATARSSALVCFVEDPVSSNILLIPGNITDTYLKRKKPIKDLVPSTFLAMCGIESKEESESTHDQLLSNIPKAVSEATKLEPLEKVETWDEFTFLEDDSQPPNLLYQQYVQKTDTLFTFDDPLQMASGDPNQLLPTPRKIKQALPRVPVKQMLIKMNERVILYPPTPRYDYLRKLARFEMENFKIKDSVDQHIEIIQVDLPDWGLKVVQVLEDDLFTCWQILKSFDLPVLADFLKKHETVDEVQPSLTRLCLIKLNEEISKTKNDPSKSHTVEKLKEILPVLLHFYGVIKSVDVFTNLDFKLALETLVNFRNTHKEMLPREFFALVIRIADMFPLALEGPKIVHSKLPVLHHHLAHHLEGTPERKVWIRLHRATSQVATNIRNYLADVGVECDVDPRILPFGTPNEHWFSNSSVIISDRLSKDLPLDLVSLVIDYEQSPKSQDNQLSVMQKMLMVQRREKKENPSSPLVDSNTDSDDEVPADIPTMSEMQIPVHVQESLASVNLLSKQTALEDINNRETRLEPDSSPLSINPSEEVNQEASKDFSIKDHDDIQSYESYSYGRCSDEEHQESGLSKDSIIKMDVEPVEENESTPPINLFEAEPPVESHLEFVESHANTAFETSSKITEEEPVPSSGDMFADPSQDDFDISSATEIKMESMLKTDKDDSELAENQNHDKGSAGSEIKMEAKTSSGDISNSSLETSTLLSVGKHEACPKQEPTDPSPNQDLDIDEKSDGPSQEEEEEKFNLIMAAHLESNEELMKALARAKYLHIFKCDYKFLDKCCKYQPDFLISSRTALIVIDEERDSFEDVRFKILNASYKCLVCWVVLLAPRVFVTQKIPPMWSSLLALSRLYEMMEYYNQNAPSFQLYFRLVTSYDQVAFIILDNAHNEQHPDIEDRLQPVSPDVELLLHFRPFNVVSAQRILQFITPKELVSLSIGKMRARLRSRHLIRIIKLFLKQTSPIEYHQPVFNDLLVTLAVDQMEDDSDFGKLKCSTTQGPEEDYAFLQSPNKKARRDMQRKTLEGSSNTDAAELVRLWSSPTSQR